MFPFQLLKIKQLLSDSQIQRRLSDCDEYFRLFPLEALRARKPEEEMEGDARNGGFYSEDPTFTLAFSHQVHKEIGVLEIFLAIMFRYNYT